MLTKHTDVMLAKASVVKGTSHSPVKTTIADIKIFIY